MTVLVPLPPREAVTFTRAVRKASIRTKSGSIWRVSDREAFDV